jgi:hypothetical protein
VGATTVEVFLRELRGVWPGATPPLDIRAAESAAHLELVGAPDVSDLLRTLTRVAADAGIDIRDLESGLVRLALAHRREIGGCAGGDACVALPSHDRERRGR